MHTESALGVIDDPEVLPSLLYLDNVHEASGELWVCPLLAVDLDQTLTELSEWKFGV